MPWQMILRCPGRWYKDALADGAEMLWYYCYQCDEPYLYHRLKKAFTTPCRIQSVKYRFTYNLQFTFTTATMTTVAGAIGHAEAAARGGRVA